MKKILIIITAVLIVCVSGCMLFMTGTSSVEIYNNLPNIAGEQNSIGGLYSKVPGTDTWSSDYMDYEIAAGYSGRINELPVGTYDLKAVTVGGTEYIKEGVILEDTWQGAVFDWNIPQ